MVIAFSLVIIVIVPGHVRLGHGGPDLLSSKGGGEEKAGGEEDGGADERGEEGTVDGLAPSPWLGEKRQMSWSVKEKSNKYIQKHNFFVFV